MATIPRSNLAHVARQEAPIPLPERVTIALGPLRETAREGLLALSVAVGLAVVAEIFEEEVTQLVGPRGKHNADRSAYRHGQEKRQLTLGGRRVEVQRPRARTKAGEEVELESYRLFASRDLLSQAALGRMLPPASVMRTLRDRQEPAEAEVLRRLRTTLSLMRRAVVGEALDYESAARS